MRTVVKAAALAALVAAAALGAFFAGRETAPGRSAGGPAGGGVRFVQVAGPPVVALDARGRLWRLSGTGGAYRWSLLARPPQEP